MVTVLFATLCIICLLTGDAIFSAPGGYVKDFLLGVFGYFAYPVGFYAIYKAVTLIIDVKIGLSFKRKALIWCAVVAVMLFSHIVSMGGGYNSYGEYISASYSRGEGVFSAGGVVAALVAYFLQALLTVVGSAVVIGALFATCAYFLVADIVKERKEIKPEREFRSTYVKNETVSEQETTADNASAAAETPPVAEKPKGEQRLFINDGAGFGFKSKREMAKDDGTSFKVASSSDSLNVSTVEGSYSATYDRDMQKKIEYIKTPAKIEIKDVRTTYSETEPRVSDYISRTEITERNIAEIAERSESNANEETAENEIPMIDHRESVVSDARSRAEIFGERYAAQEESKARDNFNENHAEESADTDETFTEETDNAEEIYEEPTARISEESEITELKFIDETEKPAGKPTEEPPASRVRESRARSFLFEEKPAFTSRVEADNNARGRFTSDLTDESEKATDERTSEEQEKPPIPINREYFKPPLDLLETYAPPADAPKENHEERIEIIQRVLEDFHIKVEPQGYVQGPTITRYEVKMPAGIPVKKVLSYDDDLKMRLQSKAGVRIEAPIPGKDGVGIEVANRSKVTVGLREVMEGAAGQKIKPGSLIFALGKDIVGTSKTDNLAKGPHYLVAGATGSGKSVCLNVMIISMLMRYSPEELRLILIDPKRVGFKKYEHLPHLMIDEIVTEPQKAVAVLQWAYKEMERRYGEFEKVEGGLVSDIESYNELIASDTVPKMPRIVIVVDELADLMEMCKKDMETNIRLLAQKARAAGIHLVLATQRPSVDVVTGTIKANLPSRIALKVMNYQDSATILSEGGAEKLLGNGDMLYKNSGMSEPERYQGAWISDREISNIVTYIKEKNAAYFDDGLKDFLDKAMRPKQEETVSAGGGDDEEGDTLDEFFLKALWLAVTSNSVSIAMLQRRFQIGYARAGGLVDKMERLGFVSGNEGSKARRVLITREEFESRFGSMPEGY